MSNVGLGDHLEVDFFDRVDEEVIQSILKQEVLLVFALCFVIRAVCCQDLRASHSGKVWGCRYRWWCVNGWGDSDG